MNIQLRQLLEKNDNFAQKTGGVLILDDTISEKSYTDENAVNCWHYSHAKHRHVKGLNLLSWLVRYDDIALPMLSSLRRFQILAEYRR